MEAMEDTRQLSGELERILRALIDRPEAEAELWRSVVMGMAGACYALQKAAPLLNAGRSEKEQLENAIRVLEAMALGREINAEGERLLGPWFVGHYLNNAELRIQWSLDRMVKIFTNLKKKRGTKIIDDILSGKAECPHCGELVDTCCPDAFDIMEDSKEKRVLHNKAEINLFDYMDTSEGACITRVWMRANDVKHDANPQLDREPPAVRFRDCCSGLAAVTKILEDFLQHLGYV